jgi:hypothetical protein
MLPGFFSAPLETIPWTFELSTPFPLDEPFHNCLTSGELHLLKELGPNPDHLAMNFLQRSIPRR